MEEALNLTCVSASDVQISDDQPCFRRGIRALDDLEFLGLLLSRHHYHSFLLHIPAPSSLVPSAGICPERGHQIADAL